MRVCVTGGSGFIGRYVCAALKAAGHYVLVIDPMPPGECDEWRAADITSPLAVVPGLDAVIHLAALANPRECDANPGKAFNHNVNGTHQVLKMALASGVRKIVFASSAHVYGISPRYLPTPETHSLYLQNTYTLCKILGEQLCQLYFDNHGLSYTVLRLFNTFGLGQSLGYFIPDQIEKAKAGKIDLTGSNITKDWISVSNVASAFVRALMTDYVGAINVGSGIQTDLGTIARFIAEVYKAELICHPVENPTRMQADWGRAKRVLGWGPTISLEEGLGRILQVPVGVA